MEFPVFQFVPIDHCPVSRNCWLCCFLLYPTRYLWIAMRSPCTLSCLSLNSSSSHSLSLYERYSGALVIVVSLFWIYPNTSISIHYWKANTWKKDKKVKSQKCLICVSPLMTREKDSTPSTYCWLLLNVAQEHCWHLLWGLIAAHGNFEFIRLVKHDCFFINLCQTLLISFTSLGCSEITLHEGIVPHLPRSQYETYKTLAPLDFLLHYLKGWLLPPFLRRKSSPITLTL